MKGTKRLGIIILATLLVVGVLVAVSPWVTQAQAVPTATVTAVPTATVVPTATAVPTATVLPTATTIPAEIGWAPGSLTFVATEGGSNPSFKTLSIWNSGAGMMHWTTTTTAYWLTLIPDIGTITTPTNQIASVQVHVDITSLTPGIYQGVIGVFSSDAENSPQMVEVILTVKSKGVTVVPKATATATAEPSTPTPTSTPPPTPPAGAGGASPWVWPVVGVLIAVCATLAGFALVTTGVLGKLVKGKPKGDVGEDFHEGGGGDSGGGGGDYGDEV